MEHPMWVMYLQPKCWRSPHPSWSWVPRLGLRGWSLWPFDVMSGRLRTGTFRLVVRKGFFTRTAVSGTVYTWRFSRLG